MTPAQSGGRAHQTRAWWLVAVLCGCAGGGDPAGALRRPSPAEPRPTGCIDAPFIAGDPQAANNMAGCGRARSLDAGHVSGRVTKLLAGGLPGPAAEGLRVSIHPIGEARLNLDALPPARAEVVTDPQGAFTFQMAGRGAFVIVVRATPTGPILAARRIDADAESRTDLELAVPADP